ncbi:MAG: prepilin-type N-terminal cleavage/methylation domain-containing protein [Anaerolineales bacterium]|nr:prepilin-type N-terminal cleavage/methylation domain-containing protein [Anaerolineales bacterium]
MLKNLIKEEGGFTLVELLVTIAILAVLFGVVTLSLTGVGSDAEETVNDAELGVVQSAVDIYFAENNISSLDASDVPTAECLQGNYSFETYLRFTDGNSKCQYTVTTGGDVSQEADCTSSTCP